MAGSVMPIAAGATALWGLLPGFFAPLVVLVSIATNAALFTWTSWILPHRRVPVGALIPAAVLGAYAVPHLVARSSEIYGTIGVVFALLAWLLVFGRVLIYVAIIEARRWEHTHGDERVEMDVPALPAR